MLPGWRGSRRTSRCSPCASGTSSGRSAWRCSGEHHLQGRLTAEEYEERVGGALQARTEADLVRLLTDLPPADGRSGPRPRRAPRAGGAASSRARVASPLLAVSLAAFVSSAVLTDHLGDPQAALATGIACLTSGAAGWVVGRFGRRG